MSLDSCRPLSPLSLSLTSLLSRPVSIQGSGVESPGPHSHWRGGRGFNGPHSHWRGGRGEASPGGRGRFHFSAGFFFSRDFLQQCFFKDTITRIGEGVPLRGPGRASSLWLAFLGSFAPKASRASVGPSWSRLTSAASCS